MRLGAGGFAFHVLALLEDAGCRAWWCNAPTVLQIESLFMLASFSIKKLNGYI